MLSELLLSLFLDITTLLIGSFCVKSDKLIPGGAGVISLTNDRA